MHLVKISGSYNGVTGKLEINLYHYPEYTETKASYVWDKKRIAKNKIGVIDSITYNNSLNYQNFYILSLEDTVSIEDNKAKLKDYFVKRLTSMIAEQKNLITTAEATLSNPIWIEKESRYDDI